MSGGSHPGERRLDGDADQAGRRRRRAPASRRQGRQARPSDRGVRLSLRLRGDGRSRRGETSNGCAFRVRTRRASSERSSTATPEASASGPPTSPYPRAAGTCPGRWCSRRRGWRERAGSSSRTRSSSAAGVTTTGPAHASSSAERLRRRARARADGALRARLRRGAGRVRAGLRLRAHAGVVVVRRAGIRLGRGDCARLGDRAPARHRPPPGP